MTNLSRSDSQKSVLVTTANIDSWPSTGPITYLGEWCRLLPSIKMLEQHHDISMMPYHWDDRDKARKDYEYLQCCYEDTLVACAQTLNQYHSIDRTVRYWRILIGPWLNNFIHVLYDRWYMIKVASEQPNIGSTYILDLSEQALVPFDLKGWNPYDQHWNHFIYGCAIRQQKKIPWTVKVATHYPDSEHNIPPKIRGARLFLDKLSRRVRKLLAEVIFSSKKNKLVFYKTYLPVLEQLKLDLKNWQSPSVFWRTPNSPQITPNLKRRTAIELTDFDSKKNEFYAFLSTMVMRQIPTTYLEGFGNLIDIVKNLRLPEAPKLIFTSNAFQFDEVFQAYTAEKVQAGTYLVIGQHGGFYGVAENSAPEVHQVRIADRFLTWGWKDRRTNVYALFCFVTRTTWSYIFPSDGALLLVTTPQPPFTNFLSSFPLGLGQSRKHFSDQLQFTGELAIDVQARVIFRIHESADKQFCTQFITEWRTKFPKIEVDYSTDRIEKVLRKTRLLVYTYNSTGYLEGMRRNIPTIIFWFGPHWELREEAVPYFKKLAEAKIFFTDARAAAIHINNIWEDVLSWWTSAEVQLAVREFCNTYARFTDSPQEELMTALDHKTI